MLVRSDTLQALTAADVDFLVTTLRLELIVDLRAGPEAVGEGRGPMADTGVCYLNAPLRDLSPADGVPPDEQALRFSLDHLAARPPRCPPWCGCCVRWPGARCWCTVRPVRIGPA